MLRTHTCGELYSQHIGISVTLCGWVQRVRNKGSLIWIDVRDRYGLTQLVVEEGITPPDVIVQAKSIGREYVIQVTGNVIERSAKNLHLPTGDIEIAVHTLRVLNTAKTPPFLIENVTDGGEDLRMQYRYLDLRRPILQQHFLLRQQVYNQVRTYLTQNQFVEIETPLLIKSTPGGARDFLVPSRLHPEAFYALAQSPQVFKQLLMVAGFDRYYQIAKCFRDEDFRADRQPEFTQIDCELSFVEQADILELFEGFIRYIFKTVRQVELGPFPRMTYAEAMAKYGTDKPDLRLGMPLVDLTGLVKEGSNFVLFQQAESILAICVKGGSQQTRSQLDQWVTFIKKAPPMVGGLVYVKCLPGGRYASSVDKFYTQEQLALWAERLQAMPGDLLLIVAGDTEFTQLALGDLRLVIRDDLQLVQSDQHCPLWVVDFPLFEWNGQEGLYVARHHPFTAPHPDDIALLAAQPGMVRACAYDLVINGIEVGGGSMRIYERTLQEKIFQLLGLSPEAIQAQFGFLTEAFEYGAPPHGGIAFGLDRLCAILGCESSIRPFIAFPKNHAGRDVMMQAPSPITPEQLAEIGLAGKS